jgi:peptidoglycan/LPS O-acetylase OafA/YrhL
MRGWNARAGTFRLGYRPELDGLRGIALVVVVGHHLVRLMWPAGRDWFLPGGQVGLDVFFALSGFLITSLLVDEFQRTGRVDAAAFLWRRAVRLVPAVAALMAGLLAVSLVGERYSPGVLLSSAGWAVTLSTNLAIDRPVVELVHLWSLSVEAHFYLLWTLTVALVVSRARRPYPVLAGIALAVIAAVAAARALAYHEGVDTVRIYVNTLYRLDGPLVGALAGVAAAAGWLDRVPRRWAARAATVAALVLVAAALRTRPISPALFEGLFTVFAACGAVLVVALPRATSDGRLRRTIAARPLVALGTVSYSVYLWHLPIVMWVDRNVGGWPAGAEIAVALAASLAVGTASYRLVERPIVRRRPVRVAAVA